MANQLLCQPGGPGEALLACQKGSNALELVGIYIHGIENMVEGAIWENLIRDMSGRIFLRLRELGSQNLKIGSFIVSSLGSYSFCIENSESSKVDRNNQTIQYKKYKSTDRPPVSLAGVYIANIDH